MYLGAVHRLSTRKRSEFFQELKINAECRGQETFQAQLSRQHIFKQNQSAAVSSSACLLNEHQLSVKFSHVYLKVLIQTCGSSLYDKIVVLPEVAGVVEIVSRTIYYFDKLIEK